MLSEPTRMRVLVVDADLQSSRFLQQVLEDDFQLTLVGKGQSALAATAASSPDLILLDLELPDVGGIEVIGKLREWSPVAIIVVSALDGEEDKIASLNAGADDYVTKPFGAGELKARMAAVLRRSLPRQVGQEPVFTSGDLIVNLPERRILVGGRPVPLTPIEYQILRLLVLHAGKVVTQNFLLKQVWGSSFLEQPHILRVNISNLRHKIEKNPANPSYILTEPRVGYRLRRHPDQP
ncbi:DNA-binding response regulator [Geomonas sp. Red276]